MRDLQACRRNPASTAICLAVSVTPCSVPHVSGDRPNVRHLPHDCGNSWSHGRRRCATIRSDRQPYSLYGRSALPVRLAVRLSALVKLISDSILVGFKAGAGLTIAMTQLPSLLALPGGGHNFFDRTWLLAGQLGQMHYIVVAVGVVAIGLIVFGERLMPGKPVALGVVALAIIAATVRDFQHWGADHRRNPGGITQPGRPGSQAERRRGYRSFGGRLPVAGLYRRSIGRPRLRCKARICSRSPARTSGHRRGQSRRGGGARLPRGRRIVAICGERQGRSAHTPGARLCLAYTRALPAFFDRLA